MDTSKAVVAGALAALVVALGVSLYFRVTPVEPQVGAVSGPEISGNDFTIGGVRYHMERMSFRTATNTICTLRSPVEATSTLIHASVNVTTQVATVAPAGIVIAKDSGWGPTTTPLDVYININDSEIGGSTGSGNFTLLASTSPNNAPDNVFEPGYWLNVKVNNGAVDTSHRLYTPAGTCSAIWAVN